MKLFKIIQSILASAFSAQPTLGSDEHMLETEFFLCPAKNRRGNNNYTHCNIR